MAFKLTGGCGCGAVRYELTAPLISAGYCHCTRCQRRTGTAASANGLAEPGSFHILSGEDQLRAWKPEGGWEKWFCADCGSALFSRHPSDPMKVGIRLGGLDSDPGVRPSSRQFLASAVAWEPVPDDGLKRYDGPVGRS
ncbi:MAG: GFA family protein [Solirubrobacterales bacterium]|nr:GFA family protein [Solirubrobacterales bacterium]MBV9918710.1 GFA family protein [Solirubrobacterales bacterium]